MRGWSIVRSGGLTAALVLVAGGAALGQETGAEQASGAQQAQASGPGQSSACSAPEYRQFDFWIGEWEVFDPAGEKVGENSIRPILGGCALKEEWAGAGGSRGESFNIWDAGFGRWHQTWVDARGTLLQLDGGLEAGRMVLEGETMGSNGQPVLNRIAWEPLEGDDVRQVWSVSSDGGDTWRTVFDGRYVQKDRATDEDGGMGAMGSDDGR